MSRRNSLVNANRRASMAMARHASVQHEAFVLQPIKVDVKAADMDVNAQLFVKSRTREAFENNNSEKDVAAAIREEMDKEYGSYWNVVVGNHFGSDVTHVTKQYIQMEYGALTILVWKSS